MVIQSKEAVIDEIRPCRVVETGELVVRDVLNEVRQLVFERFPAHVFAIVL